MKELYNGKSPARSRTNYDTMFVDQNNTFELSSFLKEKFDFVEEKQLLRAELWSRFVEQFRSHTDADGGWRGEFFGKMMRGGCFVYSCTKNSELYSVLKAALCDMMTCAEDDGRISSYTRETELNDWDIWCRKYVLLGMQYFYEICTEDDLKEKIVLSLCAQVDYLMTKIGDGEGKTPITYTSMFWRGLNASSILEPVMRLYNMTGREEYLSFAKHIVDSGATAIENIFELARENKLMPYQYPVTKAYEMTSCFEGLLEYYRVTGDIDARDAAVNFAERVLQSELTVIGGGGCTGEVFDNSVVRQANTTNQAVKQETCVTVTYMKFFLNMLLLTGEVKYADAFERCFYNAYLGAMNTELAVDATVGKYGLKPDPLPFDSYSPLTAGARGNHIGGFMVMPNGYYYGCCACIASAGLGLAPKMQLLTTKDGLAVNLFFDGAVNTTTPSGKPVTVKTTTDYPASGRVKIEIKTSAPEKFTVLVRIPAWSRRTELTVNGKSVPANEGYIRLEREWNDDTVCLELDMAIRVVKPISYKNQVIMTKINWKNFYLLPVYDEEDPLAKEHIALERGPVVLARDSRLEQGDISEGAELDIKDGTVSGELSYVPFSHTVGVDLKLKDGGVIKTVDYGSAGKLWGDNKAAAWIRMK